MALPEDDVEEVDPEPSISRILDHEHDAIVLGPGLRPGLATGGTGDVLSGVIGGLLAQGLKPGPAARLGVFLHGTAGDLIRERLGDAGLLASDLPDAVPLVRKRLAAIAERSKPGKRVGFAVRDGDGASA